MNGGDAPPLLGVSTGGCKPLCGKNKLRYASIANKVCILHIETTQQGLVHSHPHPRRKSLLTLTKPSLSSSGMRRAREAVCGANSRLHSPRKMRKLLEKSQAPTHAAHSQHRQAMARSMGACAKHARMGRAGAYLRFPNTAHPISPTCAPGEPDNEVAQLQHGSKGLSL